MYAFQRGHGAKEVGVHCYSVTQGHNFSDWKVLSFLEPDIVVTTSLHVILTVQGTRGPYRIRFPGLFECWRILHFFQKSLLCVVLLIIFIILDLDTKLFVLHVVFRNFSTSSILS